MLTTGIDKFDNYDKLIIMPFEISIDPRAAKALNKLSVKDQAKIREYTELFKEYGFRLSSKYLKKINKHIWELRPDKWRLFILVASPKHIIIHLMYKKSQKITQKTKKIIEQRTKEYLWTKKC